ncbi:MAG TPA: glycosyltransferase [Conexibacter sp.]|nr:glycosyltransferase [Conexibacter sp.]
MAETAPPTTDRVDVSVLTPVLNEERGIRETVAAMQLQRFDGTVEFLFADGRSEDRTRAILLELAERDPRIRVLDNPPRHTPAGLNACLRVARGEYVARMDAHTFYPERYLASGVERLERGDVAWVSGSTVPRPVGAFSLAFALALSSFLGRGGSQRWGNEGEEEQERELDTGVFCGVWRRDAVLELGGWDERWPINQDSEMAARFLARGDRIVCVPEMAGSYVPRESVRALARQYRRYGFYRAQTFRRHPDSMRRSHLLAPALALALLASFAPPRLLRWPAQLAVAAYLAAVGAAAARAAAVPGQRRAGGLLAVVLPTMHLAWGFGSLAGMARFGLPLRALVRALGGGAASPAEPGDPGDPGEVHAPSLHADGGPTA